MKIKNIAILLSLMLLLFQGCIPSLYPLYTKDKLVMRSELNGVWVEDYKNNMKNLEFSSDGIPHLKDPKEESPGVWIFEAQQKYKKYKLTYYDEKNQPAIFDAHLVKLGADYFLNFYPTEEARPDEKGSFLDFSIECLNGFERFHYYPVNTFAKVSFENGQISMALFDAEYLDKLLDQKRIRIKHEKTKDGYILTAKPEELQKFIEKYSDDEKAFPDPMVLMHPF